MRLVKEHHPAPPHRSRKKTAIPRTSNRSNRRTPSSTNWVIRSFFITTTEKRTFRLARRSILSGKFCAPHENAIRDDYTTLEEVNQAVKDVGLVRSQLIFGIDYTISNLETGKLSFNGLSLHHIQEGLLNPYQSVRRSTFFDRRANRRSRRSLRSSAEPWKSTIPIR